MADGAVTGFHHLSLTVRDLDVSAAWCDELFDLEPVLDEPDVIRLSIFHEGG